MKLLLDQNLSHKLVPALSELYPGSAHVRDLALQAASDDDVWDHARERGFTIVSKDSDFHQRSFLLGPPPKVVWVRLGNCTSQDILDLLRERRNELLRFERDPAESFLVLSE